MAREVGIIFCGDMVRAIRGGRKTQTRRLIIPQPLGNPSGVQLSFDGFWHFIYSGQVASGPSYQIKPRYHVGDLLFIKEVWAADKQYDSLPPRAIPKNSNIWFPDELGWKRDKHMGKVRSPLFLMKHFAHPWLCVTAVKDPQRIQGISDEDIHAEGVGQDTTKGLARSDFWRLWDSLHKKLGERWEDNAWVFPYVFEKIEDQLNKGGKPK